MCAMREQFQDLVGAATPGTETAAWQLIRRLLLAVHLWEQERDMRRREEDAKEMGAASYGSMKTLGAGDVVAC